MTKVCPECGSIYIMERQDSVIFHGYVITVVDCLCKVCGHTWEECVHMRQEKKDAEEDR